MDGFRYTGKQALAAVQARADSDIKSIKDLAGMKIGVTAPGSSTNMMVSSLLAKDGLPPDAVSIIGVGATAGAVAAKVSATAAKAASTKGTASRPATGGGDVYRRRCLAGQV